MLHPNIPLQPPKKSIMEEVAYQRFSRDLILISPSTETPNHDNRIPVKEYEDDQVIIEYPILERERDHEPHITNKVQLTEETSMVTCTEYHNS
jgi:hypothetical protein